MGKEGGYHDGYLDGDGEQARSWGEAPSPGFLIHISITLREGVLPCQIP